MSRKLTQGEIDSLPEKIMYDGLSSTYYSDEEKAFELLAVIIGKMNLMQEEKVLIIHVHVHIRGAQKTKS